MNHAALLLTLGMLTACGSPVDMSNKRSKNSKDQAPAADEGIALARSPSSEWHEGWDKLIKGGGGERIPVPTDGQTPDTIKATKMKNPGSPKMIDYWLRPSGWTTMWGHALEKYDDKNFRTDGVRWDTPTNWVPKLLNGQSSGGNMTLMTQFGTQIPSYWKGAKPLAAQTEWIFNINYKNGGIMEIFDRQHFTVDSKGNFKPFYSELVANSYYESIYWSPGKGFPVANNYAFKGKAKMWGNDGTKTEGYSEVEVINRYDTFTVPPTRNKGGDCKATEFKDVIAVKHRQFWWDPKTQTSRSDYLVFYMAKNVGWIYMLISNGATFRADGSQITAANPLAHMTPVGYVNQSNWKRMCADQFRDMMLKKK